MSTLLADALVLKYDLDGNEVWTREFGSTSDDAAYGVAIDSSGSVVVCGGASAALPGQTFLGVLDAYVRRMAP